MTEAPLPAETDIAILGAGPTGLSLALALAGSRWRVTLLDAGNPAQRQPDARALALSDGARQLLARYDGWPTAAATPILDIDISQRDGCGHSQLHPQDYHLPALGYVLRYDHLVQQLDKAADAHGIVRHGGYRASTLAPLADGRQQIDFDNGATLVARWVIHAEGAREDANYRIQDYGQTAIVCEATPTTPHAGRAWERFTPDGPLALLPLGKDYAIVLTVPNDKAAAMLALDDAAFCAELAARLDGKLTFSAASRRSAFPLKLRLRKQLHAGREVWIGNAAQVLHPVSGQGFNLALRDAFTLAQTLRFASNLDHVELARWSRERQADRLGGALFTDGVVRLFSNRNPLLNAVRGVGLTALNLIPPARHFIARRMIWGARGF